jgi:hypothetical protein
MAVFLKFWEATIHGRTFFFDVKKTEFLLVSKGAQPRIVENS